MTTIRIYGGSDDLCEIEGVNITATSSDDDESRTGSGVAEADARDEIDCCDQDVQFVIGHREASAGLNAAGVRVRLHYGDLGVWSITILPIEEDVPCHFPVSVHVRGYSAVAEIEVPEGTPVAYAVVEAS